MSVRATTSGGVMGSLVKSLSGVTNSLEKAGKATSHLEKTTENLRKKEKEFAKQRALWQRDALQSIKDAEKSLEKTVTLADLPTNWHKKAKENFIDDINAQKEALENFKKAVADEEEGFSKVDFFKTGLKTAQETIRLRLGAGRGVGGTEEKLGARGLEGLQKSIEILRKTIAEGGILPTEERRTDIEERDRPSAITDVVEGGVALKGLKAGTTALSQQATSIKETIKGIIGYRKESDKLEDTIKETKRVSTDYKLELKGLKIAEKELIRTSKDRRLGLVRVDEALTLIKENQEKQIDVKLDLDKSDKKVLETQIKLKKLRDEEGEKVTQLKRGYQFLGLAATATMGALIAASPKLRTELTLMRLEFMFMAMALGDELAPAFKIVRKEIQGMGDDFDELPESRKKLIAFSIGGSAALFALITTLILTVKWLGAAKVAVFGLGKALGITSLATLGWAVVIVALIAALVLMQFKADEVFDFLFEKVMESDGAWRVLWITLLVLAAAFKLVGDAIILLVVANFTLFLGVVNSAYLVVKLVVDVIGDLIRGFQDLFSGEGFTGFSRIGDSLKEFWGDLTDFWTWMKDIFMGFWNDAFGSSWFIDWFVNAINFLLTPFTTLWGYFTDTIDGVMSIKDMFIDFMEYLNGISFDFLSDAWEGVMGQIKNTITNAWDSFRSFTDDVADALGKLNPFGGEGGGGTGVDFTGESTAGQPIVYSGETREEIGARLLATNPSWGFEQLLAAIEAEFNRQQLAAIEAAAGGIFANNLRGFATGTPFVPSTGLAVVHKGERIIPANQNKGNGANNITIAPVFQITITGTNNEEEIIRRISERTLDEIQRLVNTI